jgi:hypothetical protein
VLNELRLARKAAAKSGALSPEASNALARATKGTALDNGDIRSIADATSGMQNGDNILALAQQANVLSKLRDVGSFDATNKRFSGGAGERLRNFVFAHPLISAAIGGGAAAPGFGGISNLVSDPISMAKTAAVGAGAYAALRGADRFMGLSSPARSFVDKFADPSVPVRVQAATQAPQVSAGAPRGVSVPQVSPPQPMPWGNPEPPPAPYDPRSNIMIDTGMAKMANTLEGAKRKQLIADAMPLLRRLANEGDDKAPLQPELPKASMLPNVIRKMNGQSDTGQASEGNAYAIEEQPVPRGLVYTKTNPADHRIAAKATAEFKQSGNIPEVVAQRYHNSAAMRQARIRDRLQAISADPRFPSENIELMEALDGLRNVRSREELAREIDAIAAERGHLGLHSMLREYFGPKWAASVWNATPRR